MKPNGNTVNETYFADGLLATQAENTSGATLVSSHAYTYNPAGGKTSDAAKVMNADDNTAYLTHTYTYDPRDRTATVTKDGTSTESYTHDASGTPTTQTVGGTTTTFGYDRNRLLTATGRLDTVTTGGQIISSNTYDGFDHIVSHQQQNTTGGTDTTTYTYDPLNRKTSQTTGGKTTSYAYLGLSSDLITESSLGSTTKSYDYTPGGARLSQTTHNTDGTTSNGYYSYNDHSDVEAVTGSSGNTTATYGYTAYGQNDKTQFTGTDKNTATGTSTAQPYSAYRYNAMRWDSTTTQYDMGFRTYDPGLNQFLSRDMYNGALADTGLSTDPFTGNRYTFGAGNPVSNIELDGHMPCISGGPCGSFQGLARWSSAQQNASTVPVQISPHVDGNQGDPKAKALQAAWSWAVGQYGAATSPEREFTLWHDICTVSSYRSLCTGMLAIDFGNMPNFRVETAFGMGFKIMIAPAVVGGVRSLLDPASMVGVKLDELRAMLPKTWVARTLRQGSGWRFGTPASGSRPFGAQGWAEWNNGVPTSPDPLHQNEFVRLSSGGLQYRVAAGENPIIGNPDIPSAQVIQLGNPGPGLSGASDLNPAGPEVPPPPG